MVHVVKAQTVETVESQSNYENKNKCAIHYDI